MPAFVDLTGQRFARLSVLSYAGGSKWHCLCDCGMHTLVNSQKLRQGLSKSCGCLFAQEDIAGRQFGHLVVIASVRGRGTDRWLCRCDCGQELDVRAFRLKHGLTVSCGCHKRAEREAFFASLIGQRFGRLVVRTPSLYKGKGIRHLICQCDCGNVTEVLWNTVRRGETQSCGCYGADCSSQRMLKHGLAYLPEHRIWTHIIARCCNPQDKAYSYYGGRTPFPVTVAEEWKTDFLAFYQHVGPRPSLQHSIDRINNYLGYVPGNLRWSLPKEQARNKLTNRLLTMDGITQPAAAWAEHIGIDANVLCSRLRMGWDDVKVLTTPLRTWDTIAFEGELHNIAEWAKKLGFKYATLQQRLKKGWTVEEAFLTPVRGPAVESHCARIKRKSRVRYSRRSSVPDTFTLEDRAFMFHYWHFACAVCGRQEGLWHRLREDHWIPLTDPECPGTVPNNIVPLCHGKDGCNNSKGAKLPTAWLPARVGPRRAAPILAAVAAYFVAVR